MNKDKEDKVSEKRRKGSKGEQTIMVKWVYEGKTRRGGRIGR